MANESFFCEKLPATGRALKSKIALAIHLTILHPMLGSELLATDATGIPNTILI